MLIVLSCLTDSTQEPTVADMRFEDLTFDMPPSSWSPAPVNGASSSWEAGDSPVSVHMSVRCIVPCWSGCWCVDMKVCGYMTG